MLIKHARNCQKPDPECPWKQEEKISYMHMETEKVNVFIGPLRSFKVSPKEHVLKPNSHILLPRRSVGQSFKISWCISFSYCLLAIRSKHSHLAISRYCEACKRSSGSTVWWLSLNATSISGGRSNQQINTPSTPVGNTWHLGGVKWESNHA